MRKIIQSPQEDIILERDSRSVRLMDSILDLQSNKADKVQNAVVGNLAGLDSNGNLTDSGYAPSNFALNTHVTSKIVVSDIENIPTADLERLQGGDIVIELIDESEDEYIYRQYNEYTVTYRQDDSQEYDDETYESKTLHLTCIKNDRHITVEYYYDEFDGWAFNGTTERLWYMGFEFFGNGGTVDIYENAVTYCTQVLTGNVTFNLKNYNGGSNRIVGAKNYRFSFNTGNVPPNITWPYQIEYWRGGSAPVLKPNTHYDISIIGSSFSSNNRGAFAECLSTADETVDISGKADKVIGATSGHLAGLDSNGNLTDSGSKASDFISGNAVLVTCSELATLRSNSELLPGQKYRITDYSCGYISPYSENAGHQFDIIVTALSNNELDKNAKATQHTNSDQDYFYYCDLSAWEVEFELLDAYDEYLHEHGKILRLKDEWNNECPYDFKNLKFKRSLSEITRDDNITGDIYLYTFSGVESSAPYNVIELSVLRSNPDYTPSLFLVFDNVLKLDGSQDSNFYYPMFGTVFFVFYDTGDELFPMIYNNKLCCIYGGNDGNTFEGLTYDNIFNDSCTGNKFYDCFNNIFYGGVVGNTADTKGNVSGFCGNVIYGLLFYNVINERFINNVIYSYDFGSNIIGSYFQNNVIVGLFDSNTLGNYIQNSKVTDGLLYCNVTGGTSSSKIEFVTITGDVKGNSSNDMLTITFTPDISNQIATLKDDPSEQLTPAQRLIIWKATDVVDKADKVSGATSGNFAGLDSNGNLTDSGRSPSDTPRKILVSNGIDNMTSEEIASLNYGDIVIDNSGTDVYTYLVTMLSEEQCCLSHNFDFYTESVWYVYDININAWVFYNHNYCDYANLSTTPQFRTVGDITTLHSSLISNARVGDIFNVSSENYTVAKKTTDECYLVHTDADSINEVKYTKTGSTWAYSQTTTTSFSLIGDISNKADKVANATSGNFAGLDSNGNLTDSGYTYSDFLSSSTTLTTITFRQW